MPALSMFYVHFRCCFFCKRAGGCFLDRNHSQILTRFKDNVRPTVIKDVVKRLGSKAGTRAIGGRAGVGNCEDE